MTIESLVSFTEELMILSLVVLLAFGVLVNQLVKLISYLLTQLIKKVIISTKIVLELLKQPKAFP